MIMINRVYGVLIRHLATLRNPFEFIDYFYWTMIDVLIFGFMGLAMRYSNTSAGCDQASQTQVLLLTSIVLWYLIARGLHGIGQTLIRDLRDLNFVATFATPITLSEWVTAALSMGTIASLVNFVTGLIMVKLFFGVNVLAIGLPLFVAVILLLLCSWTMGLLLCSFLMYWGKRIERLLWVIGWIFVPFSGVYYPIEFLPHSAQTISYGIPMYHVFAGMRAAITGCGNPYSHFGVAFLIVVSLFFAVLMLFVRMFRASKRQGLSRLEVMV